MSQLSSGSRRGRIGTLVPTSPRREASLLTYPLAPGPTGFFFGERRQRFRSKHAKRGAGAAPAFRQPRLADVAAVQDQPDMRRLQHLLRHPAQQAIFHRARRGAGGNAGAVAEAEDVGYRPPWSAGRKSRSARHSRSFGQRRAVPPAPPGRRAPPPHAVPVAFAIARRCFFALACHNPIERMMAPTPFSPNATIAAGSGAAANSTLPTRLTATSVVWADKTTATSNVYGEA